MKNLFFTTEALHINGEIAHSRVFETRRAADSWCKFWSKQHFVVEAYVRLQSNLVSKWVSGKKTESVKLEELI